DGHRRRPPPSADPGADPGVGGGERRPARLARHVPDPGEAGPPRRQPARELLLLAPGNNSVAVDAVAEWTERPADKRRVWQLYRRTSPTGAGYDLGAFWRSPEDPQLVVLRRGASR